MKTGKRTMVDMNELKQMKNKGFVGWSKYLLPYCEEYFDVGYSIAYIKDKLIELHDLEVSSGTLTILRTKYRNIEKDAKTAHIQAKSTAIKQKNEIEKQGVVVNKEDIEKVFKDIEAFNNQLVERKDPLDDLIAKQKMEKLQKEQSNLP
ncbi:hypothetical protein ACWA1C_19650 [Flectobacillus roseus]